MFIRTGSIGGIAAVGGAGIVIVTSISDAEIEANSPNAYEPVITDNRLVGTCPVIAAIVGTGIIVIAIYLFTRINDYALTINTICISALICKDAAAIDAGIVGAIAAIVTGDAFAGINNRRGDAFSCLTFFVRSAGDIVTRIGVSFTCSIVWIARKSSVAGDICAEI